MKKLLTFLTFFFLFTWVVSAYGDYFIFWLRLQNNDYELVPKIEKQFNLNIPVVSLIYDDFNDEDAYRLAFTFEKLWKDKVYHISINPFWYSLKDLIEDTQHKWWEYKYRHLFKLIKKYDVKVIFRSLHEMNWWWYSWSSDPEWFQVFWKMMWGWSRDEWLTKSNILFDMSVNSEDLPATDVNNIHQWWKLINCTQVKKEETWCYTFEDYYPWDDYVDILWITIYNWWTWARKESWAKWRNVINTVDEPWYRTFTRMKKYWKPIFIDEAWTTSINVKWEYNPDKIIKIYNENHTSFIGETAIWTTVKNDWIKELEALYSDPNVLGGSYFNADVTYWLADRTEIGELDWMAIDPDKNFAYPALIDILNDNRNKMDPTLYFDLPLDSIFSKVNVKDEEIKELHQFVSKLVNYREWNILIDPNLDLVQKNQKYIYYLEKLLKKDPVLCNYISTKFKYIKCRDIIKEKKNTFDEVLNIYLKKINSIPEITIEKRIYLVDRMKNYFTINLKAQDKKYSNYILYLENFQNYFLNN